MPKSANAPRASSRLSSEQNQLVNICRLCKTESVLRNSHIVPEFLYETLYNDKHQVVGINGVGPRGRELLQKGIREPLLCEQCEQFINEYCEKPFRSQWLETSPLPTTWGIDDIHWGNFDYRSFKLFHLSVLFRASVSSLPTYEAVSLGPHEERIRMMIRARDPGPAWQYPSFGHAVVHHSTRALVQFVSAPEELSFNGHRSYEIIFGGVNWCYSVSSHRNLDFEKIGLQADGRMSFRAVPWNEMEIVKDAAEILRSAKGR